MTPPFSEDIARTGPALVQLDSLAKGFEASITKAFSSGILQGKQFGTILQGVAQRLEQMALKAALQPLAGLLERGLGSLAGVAAGWAGSALGTTGGSFAGITPFADGGVLGAPASFPLGRGLGLAGEAGPEAIMPLARGPDGKLGVRGGAGAAPVTVTVQITTPDAESFRRSESLVSAQLARAVARGQRGL